jgi:arylsulfatase A-like enzyme
MRWNTWKAFPHLNAQFLKDFFMHSDHLNILYLNSHDTGRYVEPYGHALPTPRLQQLAEQGAVFRQAFCAAPTCSPSRAALLTGQYAHSNGMLGLAHLGFSLHDYTHHLIHTLRPAGYHSVLIGEQHLSKDPSLLGYDRVFQVPNSHAETIAPVTVDLLRQGLPQPFFLSVGFFETHRAFFPPPSPTDALYCLPPPTLPDLPQVRQDMAAFQASAQRLDQGVGAVLDAVDAADLTENTLVICTTDHGIAFPKMKCNLTDHGIGVMLIMRGPGGFTGGKVIDALVSQIDLFPTLCDLLTIDPPPWLQGESLMPLIQSKTEQVREVVFAEVTYHVAYEPQRAVRTQRWKYIRRFDHRTEPVLANCDDSLSKDVLRQYGWQQRPTASEQLYDLIFDPNEANNVVNDPSLQPILQEMRDRLHRWMSETNDPLLDGPVVAPSGAELNDPDQVSPSDPKHIV